MTPTAPPALPALQEGDRLGVWRLQRPLADVPSGQWWRASHSLSPQPVWVLVYERSSDAGAVLLRMAQAEGQPWLHPDVAWPLDSGLTGDGRPYVVQPPLEGEPLMAALQAAPLRRRLEWVVQLCELLLMARAKGLALLELDPSLLWVGPQQQLRLHALALVRADAQNLRMGSLQGQISHAAQALRDRHQAPGEVSDERAQVYAVGTLMCLLVNGRVPQTELDAGVPKVAALGHWLSLPGPLRTALDQLLHEAVHEEIAQRPADLADLATRIEAWLDSQAGSASPSSAKPASSPPAQPADDVTQPLAMPMAGSPAAAAQARFERRDGELQAPATVPVAPTGLGSSAQPSPPSTGGSRRLLGVVLVVLVLLALWLALGSALP